MTIEPRTVDDVEKRLNEIEMLGSLIWAAGLGGNESGAIISPDNLITLGQRLDELAGDIRTFFQDSEETAKEKSA